MPLQKLIEIFNERKRQRIQNKRVMMILQSKDIRYEMFKLLAWD